MCWILEGGALLDGAPELDRQGRARSARSRNTRRANDLNEAEDNRLGTMLGGQGRDILATIESARRALQTPTGSPMAPPAAKQTRPLTGGLPTIGGS